MSGLLHGHITFVKICPACRIYYRYQEFADGVHNFDDTFLIALDMCIFIRENVKNHVAVGTLCEILEQYLHIKLKQNTVLNAYLHFVALTEHNYDFNCVMCGFHPPVLIADLNRKVATQLMILYPIMMTIQLTMWTVMSFGKKLKKI